MEEKVPYFADVLLPLHLRDTYTYRIPRELEGEVRVGVRVVVQFGAKGSRLYSAVVRRVHQDAPPRMTKYVMSVLDEEPVVSERQMEFWEWMARYYMCYQGDVMSVALPSGLKLASESAVAIDPAFGGDLSGLSKYERMVVEKLSKHSVMRVAELSRALGLQKVMPLIRGMMERGIVVMDEELRERFVPKRVQYVLLSEDYRDEAAQRGLFDELVDEVSAVVAFREGGCGEGCFAEGFGVADACEERCVEGGGARGEPPGGLRRR